MNIIIRLMLLSYRGFLDVQSRGLREADKQDSLK
jgi:hypothetical protein